MELFSSAWHLISALLIFLGGGAISILAGQNFSINATRSLTLYCWHTLLCMVYCWYVLTYGGDALNYFRHAQMDGLEFDFGTAGVNYLTALLVQGLGLSLLGTFLAFNIFGCIGLQAFDACLRIATQDKVLNIQRLATLIVFLPSVSFWSSGIGKDALSFMAAGLALWAALDLSRRAVLLAFTVAVMMMVRPHMAGMMVMGLTLAALLDPKASFGKKLVLGGIAATVAATLLPFALKYAGVGETVSTEALSSYIEKRQGYNMEGGGGVDIANMILPLQLFTYMFRPILFEARTIFALAAAIDNLILLYLFVVGGRLMWKRARSGLGENRVFMWTYALLAWLVLSLTTANLGIALRQKWMFAPMLIFLFISVIGRQQNQPGQLHRPTDAAAPLRRSLLDRPKLRKP